MAKENVEATMPPTRADSPEKLREAINGLCEATYVAEFLMGLFRETDSVTFSAPAVWGLANVIQGLGARLDNVMSKLIEIEGACEND